MIGHVDHIHHIPDVWALCARTVTYEGDNFTHTHIL